MKKFLILMSLSILCLSPSLFNKTPSLVLVKGDNEEGVLLEGEYFITSNSGYEYGLDSRSQGNAMPMSTSQKNITAPFTFTHLGNNHYTISDNSNYLYYYGDSFTDVTKVRVNSDYSSHKYEWTLSLNSDGTYSFKMFNKYYLYFDTSSGRWGLYNTISGTKDSKIKLISVNEFYDTFNSNVICDNGLTPPSVSGWENVSTYISNHPYGVGLLKYLKTASNDTLNKYDYIVSKYGEDSYPNFLARSISLNNGNKVLSIMIDTNTNLITNVIIISFFILSIATSFILISKKRKSK